MTVSQLPLHEESCCVASCATKPAERTFNFSLVKISGASLNAQRHLTHKSRLKKKKHGQANAKSGVKIHKLMKIGKIENTFDKVWLL